MKDKIFGVLQRVGRSFMLPIALLPIAGLLLGIGSSFTNPTTIETYHLQNVITEGGVLYTLLDIMSKTGSAVFDNLALAMRAVGASPREIRSRIPYVLELVGLKGKESNYPDELSGGEQQRVSVARALVNNPSTIVADEPTGNLDPARSLEIMTLLERINALGTTVIVVTHERGLVNHFNKRVIYLESGRVAGDATGTYEGVAQQ